MKIPLMLAVNDYNGTPTGFVDCLEVPDLITIEGDSVPCEFLDDHSLQIGYVTLTISGYTTYVGNICWDCCYVDSSNPSLIIHHLRDEYGWSCMEAERTIFRLFETGQYIAPVRLNRLYENRLNLMDKLFLLWLDLEEWWLQSSDVRKYLRQKRHRHQARRWLRANDDTALVARLLFDLNRHLRRFKFSSHRDDIYRLKSLLIEHFYNQGFCRSVSLQKQELECWSCDGSGQWRDIEECWKCDGTGVYRTYFLYKLVFTIGHTNYIWHQPKELVRFPVTLVWLGDSLYQEQNGDDVRVLSKEIQDLYIVTIVEYLKSRGVDELPATARGLSCRQAIKNDFRKAWHKMLRRPRLLLLRDRLKQLWIFFETGRWEIEDEIPF